jgi:hypothetical protein
MTAGDIYTIAGRGDFGFTGDGGPATSARLDGPEAVVVDPAGNVLIADSLNNRVRKVAGQPRAGSVGPKSRAPRHREGNSLTSYWA